MKHYIDIIRWKNLLFLALIQWLVQNSVVNPLFQKYDYQTAVNSPIFLLLMLSTVLITAGGYVINDYFDVKIDKINRPDKVVVGELIPLKSTMRYYQILTVAGTFIGITVAFISKSFSLAFIFILTPGLLWFYSASYKRQFLVGNLIISLLAALSIIIVGILAVAQMKLDYGILLFETPIPKEIYGWTGGFAFFAFLLTLIREIIKDMEDIHGDRELECRTMPIKWGFEKTKLFLGALIVLTIGGLFHADHYFIDFENNITARYIIFGLCIPLLVLVYLIFKAKSPEEFHQASTLSKYIMFIGILFSLIFYYLLAVENNLSIFGLFSPIS
ncbi:MAG: UbiA family prenyltransferase [Porphyromonadaceae bacterium]|nr:UbiA family prenyltransferase [Porphyromonadaceae bacterium]